ncbi:MAG TPA: hypothetical protein DHV15_04675 [Treponema sp.]|uniref:Uncharacterized protein n=1 Tax=Treponema denticola (strain ATCC 35405 / DSM 14222 / CIP 103919 / JCM 8153 / KCTC 15104) TaxID=243275 RepID=Q73KI0_TREDE|nr:hypothetical protein TDE_2238 [Treponema denticola ATCC 35405]HCY94794.1 hypothetical protein [Treponema sp.]
MLFFSKIYCTQQHILPVRLHRFTAMDGGGSKLPRVLDASLKL